MLLNGQSELLNEKMLKRIHAQSTPRWVKGRRTANARVIAQSVEVIRSRLPREGTKAVSHD